MSCIFQRFPTDQQKSGSPDIIADTTNLNLKEKSDRRKADNEINKQSSALAGAASTSSTTTKQNVPSQYPDLMRSVQEIKERLDQNQNYKRSSKTQSVVSTKDHQFWSTQPVPKFG
jgi:hypothetical protein